MAIMDIVVAITFIIVYDIPYEKTNSRTYT